MNKSILLVDDDVLVLKTLKKLLETNQYSIEVAKNGNEAYEKFVAQKFDLVICDIRMPGVNGIDFVKKLRERDREKNRVTPVIFITGYADERAPIEANKLAAVDYILKPFDIDQLVGSVTNVLKGC